MRPPLAALCALALACGCSQGAAAPADAGVSRDVATDRTTPADVAVFDDDALLPAEDVPPCTRVPDPPDPGARCVMEVRGAAVDTDGRPIGHHLVSFCGRACFIGITEDDGSFAIPVGDVLDPTRYFFELHGRPEFATLYAPAGPLRDMRVEPASPLRVPRYAATGPALPADARGGSFTAGDVTLTVPVGTTLQLDLEDVDLGEPGRTLRSVPVPLDRAPPFARDAGLSALYALAPFAVVASGPVGVAVPNTARLAANAAVEFVGMGIEILTPPLTAGSALVVARGHVSADGATVRTDPGEGPTMLTWLGYRPTTR